MSSNGQKPMTWAELKAQIDTMTPEQLAMPVYYTGEDIGGPVYRVWVLGEDYINPSGDGMERVSEVRRCLIEDGMTESEAVGCISHRTLYGAVMGARRAYSKSQVRRWLAEGLGSEFPF